MDKEPGQIVRPAVHRPALSSPPRKLPYNAKHMPLGISANTLGVKPRSLWDIRRILFLGVPLTILLSLSVGVWLAARHISLLGPKDLGNGSYNYHFIFYKAAEPVNLEQGQ